MPQTKWLLDLGTGVLAFTAVGASECADAQGDFQRMHAALMANPDSIGVARWGWFADLSLVPDSVQFRVCMTSNKAIASLARDTIAARALKIQGTATLLINQQRYDGLPPFDSLLAYVDRANSGRPQ